MPKRKSNASGGGGAAAKKPKKTITKAVAEAVMRSTGELKGVDFDVPDTTVVSTFNTSDNIYPVFLASPGSGSYNRVGRKQFLRSLRVMGPLRFENTTDTVTGDLYGNVVRMVIVHDKQPSGTLPTWSDIFGITQLDGTPATAFEAPVKYGATQRFRVLREKQITFKPTVPPVSGTNMIAYDHRWVDVFVKLNNLEINYSGNNTPSTIADVNSGAIYVIFRSLYSDATAPNICVVNPSGIKTRVRYTD